MTISTSGLSYVIYKNSPVFVQNLMCTMAGYSKKNKRFGSVYKAYCEELKKNEFKNIEFFKNYQETQFKILLEHCYNNVPYYKKSFDENKIDYKTLGLSQIDKLPILSKDEVKENSQMFVATNFDKNDLVAMVTSGTTATPLKIFRTKESIEKEYAFVWTRTRKKNLPDDMNVTFSGSPIVPISQTTPPYYRYNFSTKQLLFSQYHINNDTLPYYIDALNKYNYKFIQGYPSIINLIANFICENNIKLKNKPKAIYTSSEVLLPFQRTTIENAFECRVYDYYGTTELTSIITECEHNNYHLNYESDITELRPVEEVNSYTKCEIISTGLLNHAFPLLRYKVEDSVIVDGNDSKCKCGRIGPIIKSIEGRLEKYIIITPEGYKITTLCDIFIDMFNIKEAQIVQKALDLVAIKIVVKNNYTKKDEKLLYDNFYRLAPKSIKLCFEYVDFIERTKSGKLLLHVSHLGKEAQNTK